MKFMENIIIASLFLVGQVFVLQTESSLQGRLLNSVLAGALFSLSIKHPENCGSVQYSGGPISKTPEQLI